MEMKGTAEKSDSVEDEEYVLLDLDDVCKLTDIPANAPYELSGLDTENPILVINKKLKMVGEYQETMGTCFVFSETEVPAAPGEQIPSEANLKKKPTPYPSQASTKQIKTVARLQKILKFRLLTEEKTDTEDTRAQSTATPS